jgi:NodT family efflux transporter outer membrane factor (OMF) lipoprotein
MVALLGTVGGCTPLRDWVRKGFKVGPDYCPPPVASEDDWIDAGSPLLSADPVDEGAWWTLLGDPVLNDLTAQVRQNNWTLRELGARILASRAQYDFTKGRLFPQSQSIDGTYTRRVFGFDQGPLPPEFLSLLGYQKWFNTGLATFAVGWEMDFWGKYRRAIEGQAAELDAAVATRDQGLVILQADVAAAYVQYRVARSQAGLARRLAEFEGALVNLTNIKFREGATSEVDPRTCESAYQGTLAKLRDYELQARVAMNRISVLTGRPPQDLEKELGDAGLPDLPGKLVVGIPQDLIRRRPDLREAERKVAAQSARIGVATSELLPALSVNGNIGVYYSTLGNFARSGSLEGSIGPAIHWNVLNYGRLLAKVHYEDARLGESVAALENRVLEAQREVEDGIIRYLKAGEIIADLSKGASSARRAMELGVLQYRENTANYLWVYNLERALSQTLEQLINARGQQLLALVDTYKALGGGWNLESGSIESTLLQPPENELPKPKPARIEELPLPSVQSDG